MSLVPLKHGTLTWEDLLKQIEGQVESWQRRKRVVQLLCPLILVLLVINFMWGPSWTLRILTLPALCLLTWIFLWGVTLPVKLRNQLVDAVERELSTEDIPSALRLLALLPTLGIRTGAESLHLKTLASLNFFLPEQVRGLRNQEKALLRSWVKEGTTEEKVKALLVLATLNDEAMRPLARWLATTESASNERVREAAVEFLITTD
ncbi:hypothetical protein [Armatimonas sp.]|uniref:hypothetical protein n=1 Tax=Armatimonas sp. TaxID=1872638 RepID=UPI003753A847